MAQILSQKTALPTSTEIIDRTNGDIAPVPLRVSKNALTVFEMRYLKRDEQGTVAEKPEDMFRRVAQVVAGAEDLYGNGDKTDRVEALFYNLMVSAEFLPNSPTLMNAGRELGQLSACFVLPIDDSMDSIFQSLRDAALIHKSGGGTGFSFSRLRPKNDVVRSTHGISSGPVSFMSVFDAATETIKQGGTRRGANMGILRVDHPDIREFITCKRNGISFSNFNISVAVTDQFMEAVQSSGLYNLVNPRTGRITRRENTREIFELLVENAHATGDPGIIFIDRINEANPLGHIGDFESTNPCGEQPLLPYESCNLGSVNMALMVTERDGSPAVDWERLGRVTHLGVRFLDNIIDINRYPFVKIGEMTKRTRKIGLGVMGFADLLIKLGIPYDSEAGEQTAEQVMSFIDTESKAESRHLASLRGAFPAFEGSRYDRNGEQPLRNATTTTIAPTGSISIIASSSSGIEPLFAVAFKRRVLEGKTLTNMHPLFQEMAEGAGFDKPAIFNAVAGSPSIQNIDGIPEPVKKLFRTASDIPVEWHIRIQAAFQRHTDNAVSKTINFPASASVADIAAAFELAYEHHLKGITIYRDGSKASQVLTPAGVEHAAAPGRRKPRPRPSVTRGTTEKIKTGCGNLYVTINSDSEGLCEVFCQMGRSGGCTSSQSEAISRLISLALRSGMNLDEIISELKGIRCPSPIWQNGRMILSCADAIASALTGHLEKDAAKNSEVPVISPDADSEKLISIISSRQKPQGEMAGICPDCSDVLISAEGCLVCRSCGFSKCS